MSDRLYRIGPGNGPTYELEAATVTASDSDQFPAGARIRTERVVYTARYDAALSMIGLGYALRGLGEVR